MKSKETIYRGMRSASNSLVYVEEKPLDPKPSQKIYNHSPTGFNWGYGGSGPAQLALAILVDYYGESSSMWHHYQRFKFSVISRLPQAEDWTLTGMEIERAMAQILAEERVQ